MESNVSISETLGTAIADATSANLETVEIVEIVTGFNATLLENFFRLINSDDVVAPLIEGSILVAFLSVVIVVSLIFRCTRAVRLCHRGLRGSYSLDPEFFGSRPRDHVDNATTLTTRSRSMNDEPRSLKDEPRSFEYHPRVVFDLDVIEELNGIEVENDLEEKRD